MSALVMVIDDSPTVRKILEVTLQRDGMEVVSYSNGIEAFRAITTRQLDRLPELLFLDIELPGMNGFEIARHLRSLPQWNRTAIVMLSRRDGIVDRIKARLAGTQAYLTKPCTRQMIIEVVTTTLGRQAALP
jgi:twitching motility two-component system response regulator PilG